MIQEGGKVIVMARCEGEDVSIEHDPIAHRLFLSGSLIGGRMNWFGGHFSDV